jgi:hypothetical protein
MSKQPDAVQTLKLATDMLVAAEDLRACPRDQIRSALKLLMHSNPELVCWVCYTLAEIKDEA